ncbi:hypothetical protein ACQUSY_08715 [Microbacterium sp. YY-03]
MSSSEDERECTPNVLASAPSIIGLGEVLEAVPTANAPQAAPEEKPKRKGWFGRGARNHHTERDGATHAY